MKMLIPMALAPMVLSGCALTTHKPPATPAQQLVTTLIQEQRPLIQQAQAELALVSNVRLKPKNPLPVVPQKANKPVLNAANKSQSSMLAGQKIAGLHAVSFTDGRPDTPALAGAGQAQTLRQAVTRIAPVGWQQSYGPGIMPDVRRPLEWRGNDQWPYVLNSLLTQEKLKPSIDWPNRRVSVSTLSTTVPLVPKATAITTTTAPSLKTEVVNKSNPFTGKSVPEKKTQTILSAKISTPGEKEARRIWTMVPGSTLKDSILTWSAEEKCSLPNVKHWTVEWLTSVNYRIDAPLVFHGTFMDALNGAFSLYLNASVPLYAGTRSQQCQVTVSDEVPK
ncbi:TcpQ domain-containing protein [Yersinia ruckeri]|uniref:TcpQ domain-containing protein n=1 Tax=Yersinia ruckeri TaxID=29486 RepID=UPI001F3D6B43|nr:TcpQ domain-containing protein [Yersinia ruckeri]UIN15899.1 toxin co-regulated pilus biosynthesis Q family protein [Yersinia ruckeri]